MESYHEFALVYDMFMDNVPYETWGTFLCNTLSTDGIGDGLVLDLGCGTGKMTRFLADAGYDMIGVDLSEEMLMEAREQEYERSCEGEAGILYLEQDMRSFELYGTVRAIISVCDCMNYLLTEEDLLQVLRLANNYLDPRGLFIFDLKSRAFYEKLGDSTICENRPEGSFIWENYFNSETGENQYDLTLYIREDLLDEYEDETWEDEEDLPCNTYERFEETHIQQAFSVETVCNLIRQAGMELVAVYDGYSQTPATPQSERLVFVARECGK